MVDSGADIYTVFAPPTVQTGCAGVRTSNGRTEAPSGGHFAAFENPGFFLEDVRAFGRTVRARS